MLGGDSSVVSEVGDDELGRGALTALQRHDVDTRYVACSRDHATGTVRVDLDDAGRPRFEITADVAWDHICWSDELDALARRADAVCFGTLAQRSETSRDTIQRFLTSTGSSCLWILDVNLRRLYFDDRVVHDSLRLADVVKLNDEELPVVTAMAGLAGSGRHLMEGLRERFRLRLVAVTRGAQGARILGDEGIIECAATPVVVNDAVGAGDMFTAAMALGWLQGRDLGEVCWHACRIAAFVCTQACGTPELPDELKVWS
jgi:fructokinase